VIFYVARDKWGDSSKDKEKDKQDNQNQGGGGTGTGPYKPPKPKDDKDKKDFIDFTLQDDQGKALSDLQVKIHLASGETLEATTDGSGHVHFDEKPEGPYTVEILGAGAALTFIDIKVEDAGGNPVTGASGTVELSDGSSVTVMTDVKGEVHLTDVPVGSYKFKLDDEGSSPSSERQGREPEHAPEPAPDPEVTPSVRAAFEAAHFETDKALPLPSAIPTFRGITALMAKEPGRVLLVVGHTDSVGPAAHNLVLSDDRAQSIAAYLKDDADAWMRFYSHPAGSARWDTREDQIMLAALPYGEPPYYDGTIDGDAGPKTQAAFRKLQKKNGLNESGKADAKSRKALVLEYMRAEGTSLNASADVRTLGCGDRHKVEATSGASQANRRVDVFAFEKPEIKPPPEDCRNGKHPGCDVYDKWIKEVTGPIEPGGKDEPKGKLEGRLVYRDGKPAAGVPFVVDLPDGSSKGGFTDGEGRYRVAGVGGEAKLRLVDALPLAASADGSGDLVVAVNGIGGDGGGKATA